MKYIVITILVVFSFNRTNAQGQEALIFNQSLRTLDKENFVFPAENIPHVFIFLATECPLSQNYTLPLNLLNKKYGDKIKFVGVFPGSVSDNAEYESFRDKYQIAYTLVKDEKFNLTTALNATVTPEVFLIDPSGKIVYHGAVDDWVVRLGKMKNKATVHYLENAIEGLLNQKEIPISYVKPVGCYIER